MTTGFFGDRIGITIYTEIELKSLILAQIER